MPPVPRREVRRYGPNQTGVCNDNAAKAYENEALFPRGLWIEGDACPSLPHRTRATKCAPRALVLRRRTTEASPRMPPDGLRENERDCGAIERAARPPAPTASSKRSAETGG